MDEHAHTNDLDFAGFASLRGLRIIKAEQLRQNATGVLRYSFTFACTQAQWDALCLEYANSEINRYAAAIRSLKNLCKRHVRPTGGDAAVRSIR